MASTPTSIPSTSNARHRGGRVGSCSDLVIGLILERAVPRLCTEAVGVRYVSAPLCVQCSPPVQVALEKESAPRRPRAYVLREPVEGRRAGKDRVDTDSRAKAQRFADLHREGCFLLPNAWDVGSARILEAAGFPAVATTSAGVAFSLGRTDHDFFADQPAEDRVDRETMLRRVHEIAGGISVPLSADLEDGYGESPETVATTIARTFAAGAVGGNIEDFTGDRTRPLYDEKLSADRIRAARETLAAGGEPFVLVGRTDVLLVGGPLDEAVRRANAYLEAGADCAFVPGAADAGTIRTLVRELDGPLNVVMGLTGNALSLDDLRELGVRRVTVGGSIARAMYRHLLDAARELADSGTFSYAADQLSQTELNDLFRQG
ncbi:UNVERIFIED_CONTAM: 2-methylisocitrate lyase-like PEP mutase family enzyme [Streptomyces canus]